jgi:hypothetical protein
MKIVVQREPTRLGATLGKLSIEGKFVCDSLEDEIRDVEGQPVSVWKVMGITCIPNGIYPVTLEHSVRFGPDTMTINDVPGFSYIRIHPGNGIENTDGCLLLGMRTKVHTLLGGSSRPAVQYLKNEVRAAILRGEQVTIEILDPVIEA